MAVPPPDARQPLLQVGHEYLALLGLEIFLHFQEVLDFFFFQADLESADLLDLSLHRRPLGQLLLFEQSKEFPALLHQFLVELANSTPVLRDQAPERLPLLRDQVQLLYHAPKRQGGLLRRRRLHLLVLPAQISKGADGPQVQGQQKDHHVQEPIPSHALLSSSAW
jgi:hypothetical protein